MVPVVDALESKLRGHGRVLDAGVGTGRFAGPLRDRGLDIVGLDISKEMLSKARSKSILNLVRGELATMPFSNRAFESCLMIHVLHLVDNPSGLLSEIGRVCTSKVLSLVETSDVESVRESYIRLRTELGSPWSGISERNLATLVPPSKMKEIVSYSGETKADDDIAYFSERLSAVTWDVPNEIHEKVISGLNSTMAGRVLKFNRAISLAIWDIAKIRTARLPPGTGV